MMFDEPSFRMLAMQRIETLRALASDLAQVVEGKGPSAEQLATAVVLRNHVHISWVCPHLQASR
jgi:hypothetical protein